MNKQKLSKQLNKSGAIGSIKSYIHKRKDKTTSPQQILQDYMNTQPKKYQKHKEFILDNLPMVLKVIRKAV